MRTLQAFSKLSWKRYNQSDLRLFLLLSETPTRLGTSVTLNFDLKRLVSPHSALEPTFNDKTMRMSLSLVPLTTRSRLWMLQSPTEISEKM
jgi:hypothetical protein